MKVQYTRSWDDKVIKEHLAEFLTPEANGIEGKIHQLQCVVGTLLALSVEAKTLTLEQAMRLVNKELYESYALTLVE